MRVGILTYDFDPPIGGLGIVAKTYRDALSSRGIDCTVFSPSACADDSLSPFAEWRYRRPGGCPFFSLVAFFRLSSAIRRHSIDILLVHAGSGGAFLLRRLPCPVIALAHHTYADEAAIVFRRSPLKRWWKGFVMAWCEKRTYHLSSKVLAVSFDTLSSICSRYGIPHSKISVLENPVDDVFFSLPSTPASPPIILSVSRLEERKGTVFLVHAFQKLLARVPSARLQLVGTNLMGDSLHTLCQTLGISSSVDVLGSIDQERRLERMSAATVIAVPSLLEGFGLIAAEAMSMGKAVVASRCLGLQSVVTDGVTGLLVPPGDVDALASALESIVTESGLGQRLCKAARIDAMRRFRLPLQAALLESHLRSVLSLPHSSSAHES